MRPALPAKGSAPAVIPALSLSLSLSLMQLLLVLTKLALAVALHSSPAAAPAASPIAAKELKTSEAPASAPVAAPAVPPVIRAGGAMPQANRSQSSKRISSVDGKIDIDRDPFKYKNDTLSEEAFDAAEPHFADLDCLKRDSQITIDEAATFGVKNGVPWSEIKPIFETLDKNGDGKISKDEFNRNTTLHQKLLEDLRPGFQDIDLDGNNLISTQEWLAFCHGWMTPHPTEKTCNSLFDAADTLKPKGEIDRSEFENAGRECHSIDDGDCNPPNKTNLLQIPSRKPRALVEIVKQSAPSGGALFALLIRRHHIL